MMKPELLSSLICINSEYIGRSIQTVVMPDACFALGLVRNSKFIPASENPVIMAQDWLLAVAIQPFQLTALKVCLKRTRPISWQQDFTFTEYSDFLLALL